MIIAAIASFSLAGRGPPAPSDKAGTARWLAHEAQFAAQATISVALKGFPFNNVSAIASCNAHTHHLRTQLTLIHDAPLHRFNR